MYGVWIWIMKIFLKLETLFGECFWIYVVDNAFHLWNRNYLEFTANLLILVDTYKLGFESPVSFGFALLFDDFMNNNIFQPQTKI